jgi:hypothetical protein
MPIAVDLPDQLQPWLWATSGLTSWGEVEYEYGTWGDAKTLCATYADLEIGNVNDLLNYAQAIGGMFAEVESYCEDQDGGPPSWSALFDPEAIPAPGLPWLAQWVGERLPAGLGEAAQRQWIVDNPNQRRGTLQAIAFAAMRQMTGASPTVMLWPGHKLDATASLDHVAMVTFTDETPNPAGTLTDAQSVAPWDIVIDGTTVAAVTWLMVEAGYSTWTTVKASGKTWADVSSARVGYRVWAR